MKIERTCECCHGEGVVIDTVKVGDVITPNDGSGMPTGLHHVLWNGVDSAPPFKPVRVVRIEGDALAVVPLHWENKGIKYDELLDANVSPALSWLPEAHEREVFWVYAPYCFFRSRG